jgi:hypothetical protein
MVCKPINLNNFKLEEMFYAMVWVFMTVGQASVFDANIFLSSYFSADTAD